MLCNFKLGGIFRNDKWLKILGLVNIGTCYVQHHCHDAFGVAIEMSNGIKITYSGDTLPCDELVRLGENSTILIHEATMEDGLEDDAFKKGHSTVSQAIKVGQLMKAKYTILTHFSQRYAKIPLMEKSVENVTIAFDNMEVTIDDLPIMHNMYDVLKEIYAN